MKCLLTVEKKRFTHKESAKAILETIIGEERWEMVQIPASPMDCGNVGAWAPNRKPVGAEGFALPRTVFVHDRRGLIGLLSGGVGRHLRARKFDGTALSEHFRARGVRVLSDPSRPGRCDGLSPDQSLDPLDHEKEPGAVSVQDLLSFVYSPWPALLSRHALHLYHVTLTVSPVCMSWAIRKATNVLCACL